MFMSVINYNKLEQKFDGKKCNIIFNEIKIFNTMTFTCGKIVYKIFPLKCCVYVWYKKFICICTHTHTCIYSTWKNLNVHIFNIFLLKLNLKIGNQYLRISFLMYIKMLDFGFFCL